MDGQPKTRWSYKSGAMVTAPAEIEAFIDDVMAVCLKHGMCIGGIGTEESFCIIDPLAEDEDQDWLASAGIGRALEDKLSTG